MSGKTSAQRMDDLVWSARRALKDQTPEALLAFSLALDDNAAVVRLKAHFAGVPTKDAVEDIQRVPTEILVDLPDNFRTTLELEIVLPGADPILLSGPVAYSRGEPRVE